MNRWPRSGEHHAFICFEVENTGEAFISHLSNYFSLTDPRVYAFFRTSVEGGEEIKEKLQQSLENSKMYVIVFSKNFADSKWCLWELGEIVDAARLKGKQILPIFYGVTKDDVGLKTDLYTEQLSAQIYSEDEKKRLTEAFQYTAKIEGLEWAPESPDEELGDGADLCKKTLERVKRMIDTREERVNLQLTFKSLHKLKELGLELPAASDKTLVIEDCMVLQSLPSQSGLENIQELTIRDCDGLKDIPHLGQLLSLKVLRIENCKHLETLPDLSSLGELELLDIINCPELKEILGVGKQDCDDNDNNTHDHPSSSDEEFSTSFIAPTLCTSDHAAAKVGITRLPVSSKDPNNTVMSNNPQHSPEVASSSSVMLNEPIPTSVGPDSGETNHLTNKASTDGEEYPRSTYTPPTLDASVFSTDQAVAEVATTHHPPVSSEGLETVCEGPCDAKQAAACAFLQKFICMIQRGELQMPEGVAAAIQIILSSKDYESSTSFTAPTLASDHAAAKVGIITHLPVSSECITHDAFVSFRGIDTRETFISHLNNYFGLSRPRIYAFFDTQIEGGEEIKEKLQQSLENSKMYVIVFSKNFADSKWCLWELGEIVDAARLKGKQILPIFYGVTKADVGLKTDLYKQQLSHYSEAYKNRWMEAFRYVAEIKGLHWNPEDPDELRNNADLCDKILKRLKEMIRTKEERVNLQLTFKSLPMLKELDLELPAASDKTLVIEDCMVLQSLPSQSGLENIQELTIRDCDGLKDIPHLGQLLSLKVLRIENCKHLETLPDLSSLGELELLDIINCPELKEILGLPVSLDDCETFSRLGKPDCDDNDNNAHDHPSSSDEECSTSFTAPTLCASDHAAAKLGITRFPVPSEWCLSASSTEQEISELLYSLTCINDEGLETCGAKKAAACALLQKFICMILKGQILMPEGYDPEYVADAIETVLPNNGTSKGITQDPKSSEVAGGSPGGGTEEEQPRPNK